MHHNNITAEVLYSTRTLVVNVSQLLALKVFHIRPAARMPLGHDGSLWPLCFDSCYLRFAASARWQALYMMRIVKTKNRSLLQHRGFNQRWLK